VKLWANLSNEKTGKVWTDKSVMKYTCSGQFVKGKVKKKLFEKESGHGMSSPKVVSKDTWTVEWNYKENRVTGLESVKYKGRDIVQATCHVETKLGASTFYGGTRPYMVWSSQLFWDGRPPNKKDPYFEDFDKAERGKEFKKAQKEYKTHVKTLKTLSRKCSKFKPKDCELAIDKQLPLDRLGKAVVNGKKEPVYCVQDLCARYGRKNPALCPQEEKTAEKETVEKASEKAAAKAPEEKELSPAEKKCKNTKKMIAAKGISGKRAEKLLQKACKGSR
jgi:hypothetical protein